MDERELDEIRRVARRNRMTVSEWVRQALRQQRRGVPSADRKLMIVRAAAALAYPTADIEQMLEEIDSVDGVERLR